MAAARLKVTKNNDESFRNPGPRLRSFCWCGGVFQFLGASGKSIGEKRSYLGATQAQKKVIHVRISTHLRLCVACVYVFARAAAVKNVRRRRFPKNDYCVFRFPTHLSFSPLLSRPLWGRGCRFPPRNRNNTWPNRRAHKALKRRNRAVKGRE